MRSGALVAALFLGACSFHPNGDQPGDDTPAPDAPPPVQPDAPPQPHGPYPLVLAHGLFGFKNVGPLDYFYGITGALEAQGRTVFTPRVDAVQSAAVRGQQLVDQIEMIKQMTGAPKVVIIGHSQGGLDARWAAAHDPGSVAAVVTVATPHRGSPVADVALGVLPGDSSAALDVLGNLIGLDTSGSSTSFAGALHDLSSDGAAQFNADNPNVAGLPYFSIAGRSNLAGSGSCPPAAAQFMTAWDSSVDPMKAVLSPVSGILALAALPDTPVQDGLVTIESAQWGQFLGCVPADHFDEVCQIAGQDPGLGNDYACLDMWRGIEQYLRAQDL